ncbi:UDP-N-acetylglucosamine 1-carboxyvinyltransferase [Nocardiopsis sp. CNT-189]|uniref:UDP-N-acetylglucosamine 1-carboxyvinyltransferase n=1 Tax=Nocardiopsis oceanisediminis TaxID=2816862 RepID=UPI003B2B29B1
MCEAIARTARADVHRHGDTLVVDAYPLARGTVPARLGRAIRPTACLAAALLARTGHARFPAPGGDAFTDRGIGKHLDAMRAAGAEVHRKGGTIRAALGGRPRAFAFDASTSYGPSLGATVTALLLAATANGASTITGASGEPEVVHTAEMLREQGAQIIRRRPGVLAVYGVEELVGGSYRVPPDRMAAGTLAIAAAITGGSLHLRNAGTDLLPEGFRRATEQAGVVLTGTRTGMTVQRGMLRPAQVATGVHPGYPTDLQPQLCALLTQAPGTSTVTETVYDQRATHVPGLARLGARIRAAGPVLTICGPAPLRGASVHGSDIRAATALLLAALTAEGTTALTGIEHLRRGYEDLPAALQHLGARIRYEEDA